MLYAFIMIIYYENQANLIPIVIIGGEYSTQTCLRNITKGQGMT